MSVQAILAPVFVQILLTFVLLVWMGRARFAAIRAGETRVGEGSPRGFAWSDKARKVSDCFHHQLELPILFYALMAFSMITRGADLFLVLMAWVFVALRVLHAAEHVGANRILRRFRLFAAGFIVLCAMWLYFASKIYLPV